jgi:CubicO group peptidase (beta-lactamase class C family)
MFRHPFRLALAAGLVAATCVRAEDDLAKRLEAIRIQYDLPAVGAAVVRDGRIVALGVAGTRLQGADLPVEKDDRFHLGSNAKAFTATVAGMLVDEGKLRWDSSVGEVLGSKVPGLHPKLAAVTLAQLLSNSSGIPPDNSALTKIYFDERNYDLPLPELRLRALEDFKDTEPVVPAGSPFQYANFNFVIAAAMIDAAAGQPTEQVIFTRIFRPLGLSSAGFGPQATTGLIDAPVGHFPEPDGPGSARPWAESADVPGLLLTVGGIHMNLADYARWAGWNAGGGRRGPRLLRPETLATIHAEKVRTPERPNPPPGTPAAGGYAFAWGVMKFAWTPHPVLQHNGSNGRNLAKILVDPQSDLAVVAVTNIGGQKANEALSEIEKALYLEYARPLAVPAGDRAEQIRREVRELMAEASLRSVIVRVTVKGRPLLTEAFGESEDGVPATPRMHFRIGAVAIAYLGILALQLEEERVLSLDDPVGRWIPELPNADQFTLRMLLNNTSGYPDYVRNPDFITAFYADVFRQWTPRELLETAFAEPPLFPPGTNWSYAHTNFVALGLALERATGTPLRRLMTTRILLPGQLHATANPDTPAIPAPVLHAFSAERGTYEDTTSWNPSWTLPPGAVMTANIFDVERSARLVGRGSLLSRRSFRAMRAPTTAGLGPFTDDTYYGLGLVVSQGWLLQNPLFHGWGGTMAYFPDEDIAVAAVTTLGPEAKGEGNASTVLLRRIARILTPGSIP